MAAEWSSSVTDTTPLGARSYLGEFGTSDTASLTLTSLATHTQAKVTFDLFVIGDWDGNDITNGPDGWSLTADSGIPQIDTTFSNNLSQQAFPNDFPVGDNAAQSGSAEQDTLEYTTDSVYGLSFTFPHTASSLSLDFTSSGLEPLVETWGLDNVSVKIID